MKSFVVLLICFFVSSCVSEQKAIDEAENRVHIEKENPEMKSEEDCADKLNKTAEEKVDEAINLQGADEGCTLK